MSSDVLERAREKMRGSTLELEAVYRRRAERQKRRQIIAGITAVLIVLVVFGFFGWAFEGADRKRLITTPSIQSQGWIDVTPGSVKALVPTGDCGLIGADASGLPAALSEAKDPTRLAPSCSHVPTVDLHAVAASAEGFVAVGDALGADSNSPAWFSSDGRTWSHVPPSTGLGSSVLWDVIAGGPGFIALGIDRNENPAAFFSSDGVAWTQADVELPSRMGQLHGMFSVRPMGAGFMAWGFIHGDGYVWTSPDGRTWSSVPDESVFGGDGDQSIDWIGQGPEGFVAGGYERPHPYGDNSHPAAWTSSDGHTWTRVENLTPARLRELRASVVVTRDHMTATGPTGSVQIGEQTIRFEPGP